MSGLFWEKFQGAFHRHISRSRNGKVWLTESMTRHVSICQSPEPLGTGLRPPKQCVLPRESFSATLTTGDKGSVRGHAMMTNYAISSICPRSAFDFVPACFFTCTRSSACRKSRKRLCQAEDITHPYIPISRDKTQNDHQV